MKTRTYDMTVELLEKRDIGTVQAKASCHEARLDMVFLEEEEAPRIGEMLTVRVTGDES